MNKTLCLVSGISPDKIEKGLASAEKHIQSDTAELSVFVEFITESMLDVSVRNVTENFWRNPKTLEESLILTPPDLLHRRGRFVIIQSFIRDHVFAIMRGIKSASSRPGDIIFAMLTDTAANWTVQEYLDHLKEEHEYMKTHSPENDPDMRRM